MNVNDIKKGLFVTQTDYPDSFAILAGEEYRPSEGGDVEQLLLCYYNPTHYEQNSNGEWISDGETFSIEFEDDGCEYTIMNGDMQYWRECTEKEKEKALKYLADKRIAFEEQRNAFRKLGLNETLNFGPRPNTATTTRPPYNNPFYQGGTHQHTTTTVQRKYISTRVDENWEQKEPITVMTEEHHELVIQQCDKLKYSFNSYSQSWQGGNGGGVNSFARGGYGEYPDFWDGEYYD